MVTKKVRCIYGYYEYVKSVTYDRSLKYKPYAQAGVIVDKDGVILVSYESEILRLTSDKVEFYPTAPDYSRSTISHVSAFLKEYVPNLSYHQIKRAYHIDAINLWDIDGNDLVHPITGEVI